MSCTMMIERHVEAGRAGRRVLHKRAIAAVAVCSWAYLASVLLVWLVVSLGGDRWWLPTVVLFGPLWAMALPLAVLLPAAALLRWRLLPVLAVAAVILVWPLMGLCLPWSWVDRPSGPVLRVVSCNVQNGEFDPVALDLFIQQVRPQVVLLQECNGPVGLPSLRGWDVRQAGKLVVASALPILDMQSVHRTYPPSQWPPVTAMYCAVAAPQGRLGIANVHLSSPRPGLARVLDRQTVVNPGRSDTLVGDISNRTKESAVTQGWLEQFSAPLIVAGDFNMPVASAIYRRWWGRYRNAFSTAGLGLGHTKFQAICGIRYGVRIDHILGDQRWRFARCWVGPDVGSDHRPLIADACLIVGNDRQQAAVRPRSGPANCSGDGEKLP